jgi:NAD(P)-dependent dehydrogenase (short-subunit alcohol dehydrogenase family)
VVNLAGISPRKAIEDYTAADVDALVAVNVKGPIFVTQAFLPGLRKQTGRGVSSTSAAPWTAGWRCRS